MKTNLLAKAVLSVSLLATISTSSAANRLYCSYSYKGGVGRTLAAANFAVYLAKLGQKTVVIDFDLEAPGMDSKFPTLGMPDNQNNLSLVMVVGITD